MKKKKNKEREREREREVNPLILLLIDFFLPQNVNKNFLLLLISILLLHNRIALIKTFPLI